MDESSPDGPAKPPLPIADNATAILDQYKVYLADVGNIGTRLTTTNGFYVSVITALLGVLALTKDKESYSDLQQVLGIAIPFFALLICWIWRDTMRFYSQLFRVKFDVLRELEKVGRLYPVFERENAKFKPNQWLYKSQSRIPFVLALPFVVILLQRICRLISRCCDGA